MEPNSPVRFKLGKQSSLAPEREVLGAEREGGEDGVDIDPRVRLMYSANEGDIEGIKEILECGTDVNFRDIDKRTALHVAACHGSSDVVQLLLDNGAEVDPKDRWGSTCQPMFVGKRFYFYDPIYCSTKFGKPSFLLRSRVCGKPSFGMRSPVLSVISPCQGSRQAVLLDQKPTALNRKNSPSGASSGIRLWIIDPRIVANTSTFRPSLGHYYGYPEILDGASWKRINSKHSNGNPAEADNIGVTLYSFSFQGSLLLSRGSIVNNLSTTKPLADAIHYKNHSVIKLLEKHGAKPPMAPMHVNTCREVPEYEIDPKELDFTNSIELSKMVSKEVEVGRIDPWKQPRPLQKCKLRLRTIDPCGWSLPWTLRIAGALVHRAALLEGTFHIASWRGIQVAVKKFGEDVIADEEKVSAFRDELALLQKIRHPNVVQFLGAVTQSSPMMIVTEYLPKGDLREYLNRKRVLRPTKALRFAMDIARGMNYLHEHKEAIIHRDLEPSNILRDDTGHLKVADFGVSKLLKVTKRVKEDKPLTYEDSYRRYVAPEVFRNEEYDTKVDVFSFALILQEMIEGYPPFHAKEENDVPKLYVAKERPPFKAPVKFYAHGLKELIEECWNEMPAKRPSFKQIIPRLESIYKNFDKNKHWKAVKMRTYLRAYDLWEVVEVGGEVNPLPNNPTMAQIKNHREEVSKKFKALSCIQSALSEVIFARVMASETANEAWDKLEEEFHGSDKIRQIK
ncbi:putative cyclic phosphodiesterase-like [Capsicum annuum]|nr:putative cyclic phosphodiesterase-like [Capsicum annuum]